MTYSLSIGEQRKYLESISESIEQAIKALPFKRRTGYLKTN